MKQSKPLPNYHVSLSNRREAQPNSPYVVYKVEVSLGYENVIGEYELTHDPRSRDSILSEGKTAFYRFRMGEDLDNWKQICITRAKFNLQDIYEDDL